MAPPAGDPAPANRQLDDVEQDVTAALPWLS
jgi:hypothetical protein